MAGCFEGKVVVITGASAGIGATVARECVRQGASVALLARRVDRLEGMKAELTAAGGRVIACTCDVTRRAELEAARERILGAWGKIDVVFANAGFGVSGVVSKLEVEDFRRQFETNVFGVLETLYTFLPDLRASQGRFAAVGSVMGRVGLPASGPYTASKFAVVGLLESIYYDLADMGVSVTCINPGLVASELRSINNQGALTENPDPAPAWIVMPAERAARQIVRAIHRRKPEFVVTGHGKATVWLGRHFPRTLRTVLRLATRGRLEKVEQLKRGATNAGEQK